MSRDLGLNRSLNLRVALKESPPPKINLSKLQPPPHDWMKQLSEECTKFNIKLVNPLDKHVGSASSYSSKKALTDQLLLIYRRLTGQLDDQLGPLTKSARESILAKLTEDIGECTEGFHNRVNAVASSMQRPATVEQLLHLAREDIVQKAGTLMTNEVHAANHVTHVAKEVGYGVREVLSDDPYHGALHADFIFGVVKEQFQKDFTPFGLVRLIAEQLRGQMAEVGYTGRKTGDDESGSYDIGDVKAIGAMFETFFPPSPPPSLPLKNTYYNQYFQIDDELGYIRDVNWEMIYQKIFEKLSRGNFYTAQPTPGNILDLAITSFSAKNPSAKKIIEEKIVEFFGDTRKFHHLKEAYELNPTYCENTLFKHPSFIKGIFDIRKLIILLEKSSEAFQKAILALCKETVFKDPDFIMFISNPSRLIWLIERLPKTFQDSILDICKETVFKDPEFIKKMSDFSNVEMFSEVSKEVRDALVPHLDIEYLTSTFISRELPLSEITKKKLPNEIKSAFISRLHTQNELIKRITSFSDLSLVLELTRDNPKMRSGILQDIPAAKMDAILSNPPAHGRYDEDHEAAEILTWHLSLLSKDEKLQGDFLSKYSPEELKRITYDRIYDEEIGEGHFDSFTCETFVSLLAELHPAHQKTLLSHYIGQAGFEKLNLLIGKADTARKYFSILEALDPSNRKDFFSKIYLRVNDADTLSKFFEKLETPENKSGYVAILKRNIKTEAELMVLLEKDPKTGTHFLPFIERIELIKKHLEQFPAASLKMLSTLDPEERKQAFPILEASLKETALEGETVNHSRLSETLRLLTSEEQKRLIDSLKAETLSTLANALKEQTTPGVFVWDDDTCVTACALLLSAMTPETQAHWLMDSSVSDILHEVIQAETHIKNVTKLLSILPQDKRQLITECFEKLKELITKYHYDFPTALSQLNPEHQTMLVNTFTESELKECIHKFSDERNKIEFLVTLLKVSDLKSEIRATIVNEVANIQVKNQYFFFTCIDLLSTDEKSIVAKKIPRENVKLLMPTLEEFINFAKKLSPESRAEFITRLLNEVLTLVKNTSDFRQLCAEFDNEPQWQKLLEAAFKKRELLVEIRQKIVTLEAEYQALVGNKSPAFWNKSGKEEIAESKKFLEGVIKALTTHPELTLKQLTEENPKSKRDKDKTFQDLLTRYGKLKEETAPTVKEETVPTARSEVRAV